MGRKPNQVVLQYFDRGPKLDDSSNRYQHTCKACGAFFPKGRIEGLVNHLTKKCPSLTPSQKQHIVIQFYNLGPQTSSSPLANRTNGNNNELQQLCGDKPTFGMQQSSVPVRQNFNSLNILAEASRRVGGTTATSTEPSSSSKDATAGAYVSFDNHLDPGIPLDPTLDMDSFTHSYLNDDDGLNPNINSSLPDPVGPPRPELSSIAASASEMLPDADGSISHASDFPHSSMGEETAGSMLDDASRARKLVASSLESQSQQHLRATASIPKEAYFVTELGTSFKSAKPKVRGKFGPVRRQEVREMRQRGACLRCRMLKKTCSNGSPCQACAAIESPRIWKTPCIRTKLVNEFSLYMVGLYNTTIFRELAQLKRQAVTHEDNTGLIEFYNLDGSHAGLSFGETRLRLEEGYNQHCEELQVTQAGEAAASENGPISECSIISSDTEETARVMATYINNRVQDSETLGANETGCVKASVRTLAAVAKQKNDGLLGRILQLWMSTLLLVDEDNGLQLQAAMVPLPSSLSEDGRKDIDDEAQMKRDAAAGGGGQTKKASEFSTRLINQQLRAGIEMQSKTLNKVILAELERRLVQKQRDGQHLFETFIGLVVLLNCFERICWAFKSQESRLLPDKWPFPQTSADDFGRQGERFAEIIEILADMRGLIPQTHLDIVQNRLVPIEQNGHMVEAGAASSHGSGVIGTPRASAIADARARVNASEEQQLLHSWFQDAEITQEYLQLRGSNKESASSEYSSYSTLDPTNFRSMDGRFFTRLLVPQANQPGISPGKRSYINNDTGGA